jgi:N-acetylmuramoyl-L-alanine amidase
MHLRFLSNLRTSWYFADKEPLVFVAVLALIVAGFAFGLRATYARQDDRRDLACLARNIYFESRGEPVKGQHAVAEVTMNRKASGRYPGTVCGVVYQKNWDPLRGRYVSAFSWTEFETLPPPSGDQWLLAWEIAEAVYYGRDTPVLDGAMFFHATYVNPDWAKSKKRLAKIGGHIFYK